MSLTDDDLMAIKGIVDDAFEKSDMATAAGFADVHEKIDTVDKKIDGVEMRLDKKIDELGDKLDVKESKFNNTVERVDHLEVVTSRLKRKLA